MREYNGLRFFELPDKLQRKLKTYTLRCIIITNDSHPEIRFDVFERLNTNTIPLNAQELRNCIYRGPLVDLINKLAGYRLWLDILNRREPDRRMRGEELILRFFAFRVQGIGSYRTPQKHWLNSAAKAGQKLTSTQIDELDRLWKGTLDKCLGIFSANECFRRLPLERPHVVVNRALMDLTMASLALLPDSRIAEVSSEFYKRYVAVLRNSEFDDLITRAIDHKSRSNGRPKKQNRTRQHRHYWHTNRSSWDDPTSEVLL